jgi:hypothetical protein
MGIWMWSSRWCPSLFQAKDFLLHDFDSNLEQINFGGLVR